MAKYRDGDPAKNATLDLVMQSSITITLQQHHAAGMLSLCPGADTMMAKRVTSMAMLLSIFDATLFILLLHPSICPKLYLNPPTLRRLFPRFHVIGARHVQDVVLVAHKSLSTWR